MGFWSETASKVIAQVHSELPADADYQTRKAALSKAYPFGPRAMSPYKTWCRQVRSYLAKYKPQGTTRLPMSPLEKLMAMAEQKSRGKEQFLERVCSQCNLPPTPPEGK